MDAGAFAPDAHSAFCMEANRIYLRRTGSRISCGTRFHYFDGTNSKVKCEALAYLLDIHPVDIPLVYAKRSGHSSPCRYFYLIIPGLNLALGIAGLLDLGIAASFGFSAYLTALFVGKLDITIALLAGAGAGAFLGWIKGGLARRLRSDFFAIATLAFGFLIRQIIINLDFTGGMGGIGAIPAPHIFGIHLFSQIQRYYLVVFVVVLASWLSHRLISSRTGREWFASSEDELAALSLGVNVDRSRTKALMLSSALAGMAGVLYASTLSFVEPDLMAFHVSSMILTMVILGGAGSVSGALIGAVAIIFYDKVFVPQLANWVALIWPFAIGSVPDIRGASFFNFGLALYLTVLIRARRRS